VHKTPLITKVLTAVVLIYVGLPAIAGPQNEALDTINLSTPEKAVHCFFEAFRTGNSDLLSRVMIVGGSYAEFSPQYTIDEPNPVIAGTEISKKTVIKKWGGSGEPLQAEDVLVYAATKKDPKRIIRKPGVAMPDEKFCFVLRKINGQWKLIKVYSGWPSFENR